jgi:hypothetical protein
MCVSEQMQTFPAFSLNVVCKNQILSMVHSELKNMEPHSWENRVVAIAAVTDNGLSEVVM